MDTGREWTRRSIEELIEAKLKKIKPSGGGSKAFFINSAKGSQGEVAEYGWGWLGHVVHNQVYDTGMTDQGVFDGESGQTLPVIGDPRTASSLHILCQRQCNMSSSDYDEIWIMSPLFHNIGGRGITYAWAYDYRNPKTLWVLNKGGDYDIGYQYGISNLFTWNVVTVNVLGHSVSVQYEYMEPSVKANYMAFQSKVANIKDAYLYVVLSNWNYDVDSMKAYIEHSNNVIITNVVDLDLDTV